MNIQVLPHIFKKIGLFLLIAYPLGHIFLGFFNPYQENDTTAFYPFLSKALEISALIGVIVYFISKEKIEDELVKRIRLESMSIAFILSVGILLFLSITSLGNSVDAALMFLLQLMLFLIIYYYQKRSYDL